MFCRYCGMELRKDSKFCDKCGKPVEQLESSFKSIVSDKKRIVTFSILLLVVIAAYFFINTSSPYPSPDKYTYYCANIGDSMEQTKKIKGLRLEGERDIENEPGKILDFSGDYFGIDSTFSYAFKNNELFAVSATLVLPSIEKIEKIQNQLTALYGEYEETKHVIVMTDVWYNGEVKITLQYAIDADEPDVVLMASVNYISTEFLD